MRRCLHLPLRFVLPPLRRHQNALCFFERFCGEKNGVNVPVSSSIGTVARETLPAQRDAYEQLKERIRGLSEDDQRLIFEALQHPEQQPSSKMGGAGIGTKSGDMVAAFTCGRCEHRTVKKFSRHAYTKGIVIVQCPSCEVRHLLADNLGWFVDEAKNIEDLLREKGEAFVRIGNDYHVEPPRDNESWEAKT
ncbi:zf-DNL-domain-containing protein [Trypanosoma rangeli]|uniref:Zf-DNL-domain-containing protein n=1 Tax=Trypanosoma rangeli TaxID=5698 RepID=A0A3R7LE84_TRYRA|nr:zf-DNL-domain-containing protein [Trypanosoma rangeli]RNF12636.1 zf-DNL-domain-containing protein [Trypanosoma rangeli]|eukprot:RNF12636.1 zf-DNL-domain-containing protein [Trypanosoma rangeli]